MMRILWIAGTLVALNIIPRDALADDPTSETTPLVTEQAQPSSDDGDNTNAEPGSDNGENTPSDATPQASATAPLTRTSAIEHLQGLGDLSGLSSDDLWALYDDTSEKFNDSVDAVDGVAPDTTIGHRLYVEAIGNSLEMIDILGEVLRRPGELTEEERVDAMDSLMTIEQVLGSLMVEINECERAVTVLRELSERPETLDRPLLLRATTKWLGQAEICVERERLEAEIQRSELENDQAELDQLRQRLADAQQRESSAAAETGAHSAGGDATSNEDTLVLSRSELLSVLRESAEERRTAALLAQSSRLDIASAPLMEFGLRLHYGWLKTPDFVLRLAFDQFVSHSDDAHRNNIIGGEFFFRRRHRSQFGIEFNYADLSMQDGWFLQRRKNRSAAKWVQNDIEVYSLAMTFEAIAPIDKKERFQLYFRTLLGLSLITGDFQQTKVDGSCLGEASYEANDPNLFEVGMPCWPTSDAPRIRNTPDDGKVPPVLPTLGASIGARYVLFDRVQIGIEAGWRDLYFYGNANIGFIFARKTENRRVVERNRERVVQEEADAIEALAQ